jgi:AraC family transcriptional regulator
MTATAAYQRRVEPLARGWRSWSWRNGGFDTARRGHTETVEGIIRTPQHIVMVTLSGQAKWLEVRSECGHGYSGPDQAGAVSFVPADCTRRLSMRGVEAEWASISLNPAMFEEEGLAGVPSVSAFSNADDPFIAAMLGEFARLIGRDSTLDETYCDTMSWALARHMLVDRL